MSSPRVAIVAGCRTPFARSGTVFRDLTAVDLGRACVRELLERIGGRPRRDRHGGHGAGGPLGEGARTSAREVALGAGLPKSVPAHTVNRACASANQAIADVASAILLGHVDAGIAGGAESLSDVPILHSRRMARILVEAQKARSLGARLAALARVRPRDLVPEAPAIAEPSTGLTMGQSAEKMAKENGITREEQDRIACASHRNGWAATEDGRLPAETCAVHVPPALRDDGDRRQPAAQGHVRSRRSPRCRPSFDRRYGTRHRRELVAAHRRRRRRAADVGGEGEGRGLRAARLRPGLGGGGGRPRRPAPHGAGPRDPDGARAGGPPALGHGPRRDARGVRRPGGLEHPGARVRDVGAREAGPLGAGGPGGPRPAQRVRRVDRARSPVRGDRGPASRRPSPTR